MDSPRLDENLTCDECGRHGAFDFGEHKRCPDCCAACGSCCPEFGREANQSAEG